MLVRIRLSITGSILFYILLASSGLLAQERKPAPPHEPILPRAPEMAAWTITYEYPDDNPTVNKNLTDKKHQAKKKSDASKNRVTSVDVVKTGDAYHKIVHWDTGAQNEEWNIKGHQVIKDENSQYIPTTANGPSGDDYSASDFEDLAWISMKYYAGLKQNDPTNFVFRAKHKGRPMTRREKIAYEILKRLQPKNGEANSATRAGSSQESMGDDLTNEAPDAEDVVILDTTTQMPVEYDQGAIKWLYRFTEAPTSQLEPPSEVNTLLEQWDNFIKSSETTGSPP